MTLAHRETLHFSRKLDYRYVCIEAFGIIQDDKDDWAKEAVKIAEVYGNAELTIAAGRSDNSLRGYTEHTFKLILPPRSLLSRKAKAVVEGTTPGPSWPLFTRPKGEIEGTPLCYIRLGRSGDEGPDTFRAWCF